MEALKINSEVSLINGLSIPSGAIVIICQGFANIKLVKEEMIPAQVITEVYKTLEDYQNGSACINQIADFNPSFLSLQLTVNDYETKPTQDLLINVVKQALDNIYPDKIEIINYETQKAKATATKGNNRNRGGNVSKAKSRKK